MRNNTNQPEPATVARHRRRRHIPVLPTALAAALLATTAVVAAVGDPKLPPYVGD